LLLCLSAIPGQCQRILATIECGAIRLTPWGAPTVPMALLSTRVAHRARGQQHVTAAPNGQLSLTEVANYRCQQAAALDVAVSLLAIYR
jgi:hypothetical protein